MHNEISQPDHARTAVKIAFLVLLAGGAGWGQIAVPVPTPRGGIWVSDIAVYSHYYSRGLVRAATGTPFGLRSDVAFGSSGTVNVLRTRERDRISIEYTPSYTRRARYTDWNSVNHSFSANFDRSLAPRLRFGLSLSGTLMNFEDFQFSPTALSTLASRPGTAANLADLLASRSQDWLTGSLGGESDPTFNYILYGRRVFASSLNAMMSYSKSPRLSFFGAFGVIRSQYLSGGESDARIFDRVTPHLTSGLGTIGLSYSVSPRTSISLQATSNRQVSRVQRLYLTTVSGSIERMLTLNWFARGNVSLGTVTARISDDLPSRPLRVVGGGGLGYRRSAHTWLVSYDRRVGDIYGRGFRGAYTASMHYRWSQLGSGRWSFALSGNRYQLAGISRMENWRGTASLAKQLTRTTALQFEYAYMYYRHTLTDVRASLGQNALRALFVWNPARSGAP